MKTQLRGRMPVETGCKNYDDCFTCPFPDCLLREKEEWDEKQKQIHETVHELRMNGMSGKQIAEKLGIEKNMVAACIAYYRRRGVVFPKLIKKYTCNGESLSLEEWSERSGISEQMISRRLCMGQNFVVSTQNQRDEVRDLQGKAGAIPMVAGFVAGASPCARTIAYQEEISPTIKGASSGTSQVPTMSSQIERLMR